MKKQEVQQDERRLIKKNHKHRHIWEVYLLFIVCCVCLMFGCSYLYQTKTVKTKKIEDVVFRLEDYILEQKIPFEIRCFAGEERNMSDMLHKKVEPMIIPIDTLSIPDGFETTLTFSEYIYEDDDQVIGPYPILLYDAIQGEEYRIVATIMDVRYPQEPYENYMDKYNFKEYKGYEIAISQITSEDHHVIYRVEGFHKNHKYKISMYFDVETKEDFEKFLKSFLI